MRPANAEFIVSAANAKGFLYAEEKPVIAVCGRSNVGKSSFINMLSGRKKLARTSGDPGRTRLINYFDFGEFVLADLPGYGYAKVSQSVKEQWGKLIERYLHHSKQLKAVFLLVDIRHKPSENDKLMYDWIVHNGYAPIIIATKADKLKRSQLQKHISEVRKGLDLPSETAVIPFSALSKQGREEIWDLIEELMPQSSDI